MEISKTPKPPYYAVIFTSIRNSPDVMYDEMAKKMNALVKKQKGFLGQENASQKLGITVSYWKDLHSIKKWKENSQHLHAQEQGHNKWYSSYKVRICKVEKDYSF